MAIMTPRENLSLDATRRSSPGPEILWLSLRVERRLGNKADEESLAAQLRRKFPDSSEYQEFLKGILNERRETRQ